MQISGFSNESFVDGPGIRIVVFTQGCPHACPHCHNPQSWDLNGGEEISTQDLIKKIKQAIKRAGGAALPAPGKSNKKAPRGGKVQGVTFSGGEPFLQAGELATVATAVKKLGLDITTYTGYTYEELTNRKDEDTNALLALTDYLIDGLYIHKLRDIGLKFRGSSNQRIIDMADTRKNGEITLFQGG